MQRNYSAYPQIYPIAASKMLMYPGTLRVFSLYSGKFEGDLSSYGRFKAC